MRSLLVFMTGVLVCAGAVYAQVYKCPDGAGKTVIQQIPCTGGTALEVKPASGRGPSAASPAPQASSVVNPAAPAAAASVPGSGQPPVASTPPAKDALTRDAETCLAWYAPSLHNPRDAYYTRPSRDGRVVTITIHATNKLGGVVTKDARCEIQAGKLDRDWTKIHAERLNW